jgi:hypothetical protein
MQSANRHRRGSALINLVVQMLQIATEAVHRGQRAVEIRSLNATLQRKVTSIHLGNRVI